MTGPPPDFDTIQRHSRAMVLTDPREPAVEHATALRTLGCEVALVDTASAALALLQRGHFGLVVIAPWRAHSLELVAMLQRADGSMMDRLVACVDEPRDSLVARLLRRRGLTVLGRDQDTDALLGVARRHLGTDAVSPRDITPLAGSAPAPEPEAAPLPPASTGLAGGRLFAGRYDVIERLGRGGSADVYRVFDREQEEMVALKVLRRDTRVPQAEERLRQELMVTRDLRHPNVVRTYELGEADGTLFFTMELLRGTNLQDLFEASTAAPRPVVGLSAFAAMAWGLAAAHRAGVVHRDVKPENVFLGPGPDDVKVTDFGIARPDEGSAVSTAEGTVLGTLEYMAPEVLLSPAPPTPAVDLWAMGVMLYLDWTGWLPFSSENDGELIHAICHEQPMRPRSREASVPVEVEALILRLLDKRVRRRLSDALALADELERLAELQRRGRLT